GGEREARDQSRPFQLEREIRRQQAIIGDVIAVPQLAMRIAVLAALDIERAEQSRARNRTPAIGRELETGERAQQLERSGARRIGARARETLALVKDILAREQRHAGPDRPAQRR